MEMFWNWIVIMVVQHCEHTKKTHIELCILNGECYVI